MLAVPNQSEYWLSLPVNYQSQIFRFFSCRDLLSIEQVDKEQTLYTTHRWQHLCQEKNIPVDWSKLFDRQDEKFREKFTYRTEMALQCFLYERKKLIKHLEKNHSSWSSKEHKCKNSFCTSQKIATILARFNSVKFWNCDLFSYINDDLNEIDKWDHLPDESLFVPLKEYPTFQSLGMKVNKKAEDLDLFDEKVVLNLFPQVYGNRCPGSLLLQGLLRVTNYQVYRHRLTKNDEWDLDYLSKKPTVNFRLFSAYIHLKLAIESKVVHAGLIAHQVLKHESPMWDVLDELAMYSAHQGHYQFLEEFLWKNKKSGVETAKDITEKLMEKCRRSKPSTVYPPLFISYADCLSIYSFHFKLGNLDSVKAPAVDRSQRG